MKCPYCQQGIHESFAGFGQATAGGKVWKVFSMTCPECSNGMIRLTKYNFNNQNIPEGTYAAFPQNSPARPVAPEVTDPYRQDFIEACEVLALSPKASAALSRRNLQAILRDKAGTTKKDLFDQIEEVVAAGNLPSHIADDLHAVRNIGNFAAHEIKSKVTGAIVDVEAGEAEWNLDVLESLFDFYFIEPTKAAKRRDALNKKLRDAGKPELS
jgi:hypothetical protein